MMSLRLIPPGEIAAIFRVVTPGLIGEREDILLVVTPVLERGIGEDSTTVLVVSGFVVQVSTASDSFFLQRTH